MDSEYDFTTYPEVVRSARDAHQQDGIDDPNRQLSLAEVHDCFTPTELILMEDLGFSDSGRAVRDSLAGEFDADGSLPVNPDGGLKSFEHSVGASGLRPPQCWRSVRRRQGPNGGYRVGIGDDRKATFHQNLKQLLTSRVQGRPGDHGQQR